MTQEVHDVTVVGAGTMGHGIAQVTAVAGLPVTLVDVVQERLAAAVERIHRNLDDGIARRKVEPEAAAAAKERIRTTTELASAVPAADLVIEAVPEKLDLKTRVLREVEALAAPTAILATNTSSLSVSTLQDAVSRPGRVVGLHFFNPVHIVRLLEVVRAAKTEDDVVAAGVDFAKRLGKEPIVVNDSPGFASSRLGVALGLEAMRMLEEGVASAESIDKAMELGYRHPMGPLRLSDLIGLDVRLDISQYLYETLGAEHFRPPAILRDMVAAGKLGRKTGEGFYRWEE